MARSALTFEAFAHPLRAQILARLLERPASPSELAREFGASIGVVSYHARRLEKLGIARVVRTERPPGHRGPPQTFYGAARLCMPDEVWLSLPAPIRSALTAAALRELSSRLDGHEAM